MSATDDEFTETIRKIISAQHFRMAAAAGAWLLMVRAAHGESGALGGVAANVEAERGVGLLELADRIEEARGWTEGAGAVAQQIAEQLVRAASKSAQSSETAEELRGRYHEVRGDVAERMAVLDGPVALSVADNGEIAKRRLLEEARETLEALGEEFALVIGGDAPAATGGGGGGASGGGFVAAPAAGGRGVAPVAGGGAVATAGFVAPNGSLVGPGDYPYGHVLGPEQGDFAGWVVSPNTGFLTDPATGREFDPVTGRWIDPVTGRPFGEVTEYASRLSGLGAGPGAVAGIAGGAVVGAGGGLAGLYGGVMPPSVQHAGPARGQMMQQATRNLGHRAGVATRFALNEAAQGGRPFTPPPGSSADGRRTGAGAQPGRG
ncbi:hypothetical protein, partial [Streptomyces sodiiphilus]|uniref:hypothetical protein n=1 Tax=Streptomyces sodiiphilus TaxID=226217 RepID=UPI0031E31D70